MGGKGIRRHGKVIWPGFSYTPSPRHVSKVGRNEHCPCGSGKKYKDCHESAGTDYLEKLARRGDKQRLKELRQRMKARGVPWYKRIFIRP
jgi:hypothetical protein